MTRPRTSVPHTARVAGLPPGLRSTRATRAVLALFDTRSTAALSPAEVQAALERAGEPVNRVTVYRLLDRLVAAGALQRHVDAARISRYGRRATVPQEPPPRLECRNCSRQFALAGTSALQPAIAALREAAAAAGLHDLDVAVRGCCPDCSAAASGEGAA
ncbi:Fur family transcriptional regulator [Acidovorax lacteus]|uniref:Ferric uptake regulation protein n=1 Tax=Acidovorax lacteus TaxID=1924988 RepID=A0ABP8L436_9BURK